VRDVSLVIDIVSICCSFHTDYYIIKEIVPCEIVISELVPNEKIVLKEMEKVVGRQFSD
jgi:hypothetical protein